MKTTKDYSNLLDVIEKHFKPDELDPIALTMTLSSADNGILTITKLWDYVNYSTELKSIDEEVKRAIFDLLYIKDVISTLIEEVQGAMPGDESDIES
jgi:hypothetical protein